MKKTIYIFILIFIVFVHTVFNQETKTIVVAGDEEDIYTSPYTTPKGRQLDGICTTTVKKVADKLDIKIDYRRMPFDKLLNEAKSGNVDAIIPVIKKNDRLGYLHYPKNGIWVEENYLVTLKKYGINYTGDLNDLAIYPIGVVKGYSYGDKFDKAVVDKKIQTISYPGNRAILDDLKKGKIKIASGNKDTIEYLKRQLNISDLVLIDPCLSKDMLYMAFSKKKKNHEELAKRFSDGIEKFRRSSEYKALLDTYGISNPTVKLAYNDWSPYYGPDMPNNGPIAEIVTQAFKRVGYDAKSEFLPWANLIEKLKTERYDAGFAAYFSIQRVKDYIFSDPIGICSRVVFLKKKTMQVNFTKLEDLKAYRIGVTRKYIYGVPEFDDAKSLNKVESTSEEASIRNLIKGRLDLVIIDKAVAQYLIGKNFIDHKDELDFFKFTDRKGELYLFISITNKIASQLKREFDYGLKQIKEDGTFDRIIKEYEIKYGYSYETNKK